MKECELCKNPARMYCESDQASLCWICDAKVHSANFLVARHVRSLLCQVCQSPTPWKASGSRLGRTVSVCERCACKSSGRGQRGGQNAAGQASNVADDEFQHESEEEDEENDETDDSEDDYCGSEDDGDEENQVVPSSSTSPPPVMSSSSGDESSSNGRSRCIEEPTGLFSLKRTRENADLVVQDHQGCATCHSNNDRASVESASKCLIDDEVTSRGSFSSLKKLKRNPTTSSVQSDSIVCSLDRFQDHKFSGNKDATATILEISGSN